MKIDTFKNFMKRNFIYLVLIMSINKIKVICTIGPSSNNPEILRKFVDRGVDFFRINLSHTSEEDIERMVKSINNAIVFYKLIYNLK